MNKITTGITILLFLQILHSSNVLCHNIVSRLKEITIYNDSPSFDKKGFAGPNIKQNGEFKIIKNIVKPGDIIFDIGANIGDWSKAIFSVSPNTFIYAFEPIPSAFDSLLSNILTNKQNFFAYNIAFSNTIGKKEFCLCKNASRLSGFYNRKHFQERNYIIKKIIVKTDTLDAFCTKHYIDHIDFIKIDTEGEELKILQGAPHLLTNKAISIIQFEYGGTYKDAKTTLKEVYTLLSSYNYKVFRIAPFGLIKISKWRNALENYQYSNFLAIRS